MKVLHFYFQHTLSYFILFTCRFAVYHVQCYHSDDTWIGDVYFPHSPSSQALKIVWESQLQFKNPYIASSQVPENSMKTRIKCTLKALCERQRKALFFLFKEKHRNMIFSIFSELLGFPLCDWTYSSTCEWQCSACGWVALKLIGCRYPSLSLCTTLNQHLVFCKPRVALRIPGCRFLNVEKERNLFFTPKLCFHNPRETI